MTNHLKIHVGWDKRELDAFDTCVFSLKRRTSQPLDIEPLMLQSVRAARLYDRPTQERGTQLWDVLSGAPMATEFAISRFLVPFLDGAQTGVQWALFMDCDMLALDDVAKLFALADPKYAVLCVQHRHEPVETHKMDGQEQTLYQRKNWSSLMLWNCAHPANRRLTLGMINTLPGRDLHRFCWLDDDEIGALPEPWNWLEGHSDPGIVPSIVHFTRGGPWMEGWEDVQYGSAWLREYQIMYADRVGKMPRRV